MATPETAKGSKFHCKIPRQSRRDAGLDAEVREAALNDFIARTRPPRIVRVDFNLLLINCRPA